MMGLARPKGQWGKQRPIHKYLHRQWNVSRQAFDYIYPDSPNAVGGGMMPGEDPEDAIRRTAAEKELDYRRESEAGADLDSPNTSHQTGKAPAASEEKEDPEYLHGFEEGYSLGKRVEAAEERE